ncbi:ankyrin repeat and zinc finger domain-containing protein 1 isoform X1 [Bufo gargarizans]|uniref:ankyrin repeat and zinc finger domain-containing protein 1 isoform X1 n=2 Tax=Bufo gargarizans TaxID=30331 RepID=UPI001CF0E031|nr:ankyrin repeat and zinc finger domain-containing protein 1 isoform X1 [Bufo gargarizans]
MEGSPGVKAISLFDLNPSSPQLSGLSLNNNANGKEDFSEDKVKLPEVSDRETKAPIILEISDRMTCSACQCAFDTREEQKEHYTLDWHRFNLKRRIKGATVLSEEDFQDKTRAGDVSSISGSDSESSDEVESETASEPSNDSATVTAQSSRAQSLLFRNGEKQFLSVYRCVLGIAKDMEVTPEHLLDCVRRLQEQPVVVILMAGGGHFAGAVYKGKEVVKHKTFHRYTVRAKRGSAQSVHDAKNCGHMAKSAGAALRRYNQTAMMADIHQLLQSWAEHIEEAQGIFLRAPRSDKTLFLGRNSPITRKDPRVFGIPFCTRRATFREVHRVHTHLFKLQLCEKDTPSSLVSRTRERSVRPRRSGRTEAQEETTDAADVSEEEVPDPVEYVEEELTISTLDLREYEVQPKRKRKKKKKQEGTRPVPDKGTTGPSVTSLRTAHDHVDEGSTTEEIERRTLHPASALEGDEQSRIRNVLFTCCKTGDTETAKQILQDLLPGSSEDSSIPRLSTPEVVQKLVNERLPVEEHTLLHVAAAAGQGEIACLLMAAGWDPALRDSAAKTPYSLSADKRTRNSFRKYREENPEKYNYSKSQIPEPISEVVEARKAEKKRVQRAQRKQKEKEDKEERLRKEAEEAEKNRFAALNDREKRAIAAERRLAAQLNSNKDMAVTNIRRCWQCGESLLGRIPFDYLEFSFCTTRCLQEHRRSQAAKCQK